MNDRDLHHLLPDFLGGRLDEATCREIESRLEQSEELRHALEAARHYTDALGAIDPVSASDDFLQKVHHRLSRRRSLLDLLFNPLHSKLPIELAGVAVAVLLVVLLYNPFSGRLPSMAIEHYAQKYESVPATAAPPPSPAVEAPVRSERSASEGANKDALLEQKRMVPRKPLLQAPVRKMPQPAPNSFASAQPEKTVEAPSAPKKQVNPVLHKSIPPPAEQSIHREARLRAEVEKEAAPPAAAPVVRPSPPRASPSPPAPPAPESPRAPAAFESESRPSSEMSARAYAEAESPLEDLSEADDVCSSVKEMDAKPAPRMRKSREKEKKNSAAKPASPESGVRRNGDPLAQIARLTRRHRGSIDSVLLQTSTLTRIRVTLPTDGIVETFEEQLAAELGEGFLIETEVVARSGRIIIIVEVSPR